MTIALSLYCAKLTNEFRFINVFNRDNKRNKCGYFVQGCLHVIIDAERELIIDALIDAL